MNATLLPITNPPSMRPRGAAAVCQRLSGQAQRLVSVCAWCPPETYQPLKEDEAYTHGICLLHKRKLLAERARAKRTASVAFWMRHDPER